MVIDRLIRFCLENRLVVWLTTAALVAAGLVVAPFDWKLDWIERRPVPVDAIPDLGENQQIVFTEWSGRSPQDVEDQITYPLASALLGLPGVRAIRASSDFGFSSIYVIFDEDMEFYASRSRILEKLSSLPPGALPEGVAPQLGPDATALGQVFWYTIEGRDEAGNPAGGWDLAELRSVQDWQARFALQGVPGVAEVASIGGFVKEYHIEVDPDALRVFDVSLQDVFRAAQESNLDVGARTTEINGAEYMIRGLGFVKSLDDLRRAVVTQRSGVPITLDQVATVTLGPAPRAGALDKGGAEAVGGVVVARFGENPLEVIDRVKAKIAEIAPSLPRKTLEDGRVSQLAIVPFYDRSGLIHETLDTLEDATRQQILVTIIVVALLVLRLRSAALISIALPLAVLAAFLGMKLFGVDANVVALSGIAIAIGTIVDMGIVLVENASNRLDEADPRESRLEVVHRACSEVGGAVLTAVLTTVIGFLPVFFMEAEEGKLFRPLAFTKTFALLGSIAVALTLIPALIYVVMRRRPAPKPARRIGFGRLRFSVSGSRIRVALCIATAAVVAAILARDWSPYGPARGGANLAFAFLAIGILLGGMYALMLGYPVMLKWILRRKAVLLAPCGALIALGLVIWLGWGKVFAWAPEPLKKTSAWSAAYHAFPGLGREFMPSLDEGSFLFMPTTMPHASIGEAMDILRKQDLAILSIPEVDTVVGKLGRVDSPLDPAPISMFETVVNYVSEYKLDARGEVARFRYDERAEEFARDENGELIADESGRAYRQWRDEIRSPDDIWDEIARVAQVPGATSAPKLQPIETRRVMLQSGMRAPMGIKVFGPDLQSIDRFALQLESALKTIPAIRPETVLADRVVGKPYLEVAWDRDALARRGISIQSAQEALEIAIGGRLATQTVEGRERYGVRVRYPRELRGSIEAIGSALVAAPDGAQAPLRQFAEIRYEAGPQMIKSENAALTANVLFNKQPELAEVEVVEQARAYLEQLEASGEIERPAGLTYRFAGAYESQIRAAKTLRLVLPAALAAIFLILYFQFRGVGVSLLVFSGVALAGSGGFLMLWLYGQPWFLDVELFGRGARDLFQMGTVNLSVAVWVGFLALFGIATDDGVLICTYLRQVFAERAPKSVEEIRAAVVAAGSRRIRPAMMTTATTIIALLPVLTSSGRGSDVMAPMAIPTFGGMTVAILTVFFVPTVYCWAKERALARSLRNARNVS